jgi:transcriptional regulator with GAF, ATPase, and Fis domain
MEAATDSDVRFDPNFALALLLELGRERSVQDLVDKLTGSILRRPGPFARMEVWLIEDGDICSHCPRRPECPDQTRCLHLVASRDCPLPGSLERTPFQSEIRMPLGVGRIGKIAATAKDVVLTDLDHAPPELFPVDWLQREQIRAFSGAPISFKGEVMGVLAAFARLHSMEEVHAWRDVFAHHIGGAVANARAFEEIQRLKTQLELENDYLKEEVEEAKAFGELIGQSPALRQIVSQIDLVAATEASVLVWGETGTGKELVAREIHNRSRRKDKPLVRVNCACIPKELFESEFFGHTRGAFTGAIKDRAGRFEAAEGGTIFLDEIGEVPLDLQSKLLRVLQEKRYERVGEDRTRLADVRIIGATNRDLKNEVAAGRFREDLYYRLNVFPIQVTPLRERVEDIPLLAKHFIELSVRDLRCPKPRLTRAGIAKLQDYDWPGNIRELRNVIERAVIISRGGVLDFDLPVTDSLPAHLPMTPRATSGTEPEILTEPEMQRRERDNLLAALTKTNWKIRGADGAAELLGLKPTTLVTRMQKMGLKRPAGTAI